VQEKKLNVLVIARDVGLPWAEGVQNTVRDFLVSMSDHCNMSLLALNREGIVYDPALARDHDIGGHGLPKSDTWSIKLRNGLDIHRFIKAHNIHIVHLWGNSVFLAAFVGMLKRLLSFKVVVTTWLSYPTVTASDKRSIKWNNRADLVIVPTWYTHERVSPLFSATTVCLPFPVLDRTVYVQVQSIRRRTRERLGLGTDDFVIFCGTHLHPRKGQDVLVRALSLLPQNVKVVLSSNEDTVRFDFGGREYLNQVRAIIGARHLNDRVKFIGFQENIDHILLASDVVALPLMRSNAILTIPRSVMEAYRLGLPILASDLDSYKEIIKDQYNGILFPPGDHEAIAMSIQTMLEKPRLLDEFALNNRRTFLECYSEKVVTPRIVSWYKKLQP
jgi:glycosyltransferase involved in cell wall biosynthesis